MAEPHIPQKKPYVLNVEPGVYVWCTCGKSSRQPFCDSSHIGTEFKPKAVTIKEAKTIAWCGCKKTSKIPFCDGTHSKL